jgi:exodeoxyribonuclease V beta subunit
VSAVSVLPARRIGRPPVLGSIPLDRSAVIEASAGTGKTFTLEHLVVELLLNSGVTLDRILVVTFTEKATNELRIRLRAKLEEIRSGVGDEPGPGQDFWRVDDDARGRLELALRSFDAATITTIHAFCQRVLRENAFTSGRLFHEQQIDGRDAFARAMREALRRDVACDGDRAAWLEAALGSGWSIGRIEELLWACVEARGELRPVLRVAELRRALDAFPVEDARRADGVVEMRRWGLHPTTAKTIARRLYEIADVVDRAREVRSVPAYVLDAQDVDFGYLLEKVPRAPPGAGPTARLCDAALTLARLTPTFAGGLAQMVLPPVRAEVARRKRDAGQYDFDDMLALVDEALRGPHQDALAAAMRERWHYVLIDEFQDTDEMQWSIFRRGFFDRAAGSGVLYLVGDPKQSIYRFRGADVQTYLRARGEIVGAGGARVSLDHNYRATPALVDATNAIFDPAAKTPVFTGSLEYTPVTCGRPERALVDGDGRELSPVHILRFGASADFQALSALGRTMAREIRTIADPARSFRLDGRPLSYGDVFVLTRNGREGRTIGAALRAAGVPHASYKQDGLFQTDEARELRTLLLAIDDPDDRARRLAAWLTPFFGLPLVAIERARDLPNTHPLVARLHAWKALANARDFDGLFEGIVADSGVVRREIFFSDGERELTNYLHVLELLLEHAHRTHATLRDLVHALSGFIDGTRLPLDLEGNVQRLESERRAVQIMTIHKSKGLEAAIVFVAGGFAPSRSDDVRVYHDEGRRLAWVGTIGDPEAEARAKTEEREEEQRLMYVALTRAKGRLYLPCALADSPSGGGERGRLASRPLRGPYGIVNRRLAELLESGHPLFSVEDLEADAFRAAPAMAPPEGPGAGEADDFRPPAALLYGEDERMKLAELRRSRTGAFVTSYTRMQGERPKSRPARDEAVLEAIDEPSEAELPGARTSGVFLHELLERVPLASFAAAGAIEVWRGRPDVTVLFDEAMAAHRIDRAQREHAERLVWVAYMTPLALPGGRRVSAIAATSRVVREMDFVFPIRERAGGASTSAGVRGYVRGSIDLAFEHGGLTYFVDWKSDSLRSYSADALERHVRDHYDTQAQLYAAAVVKLLGVTTPEEHDARFGGMLYCFLRGLDDRGRGLWSARPTLETVLGWERALPSPRGRPKGSAA